MARKAIFGGRPWQAGMDGPLFRDRREAGRQLAERLSGERFEQPIVLALPRGGVPVGYEIACALDAPLDVFPVRKLGAPGHRELGLGAIAPGGVRLLNRAVVEALGVTPAQIAWIAAEEQAELDRRLRHYRGDRPLPDLRSRTVILIDDGLATGVSALAAIRGLRELGAQHIVLAVPVCAAATVQALRPEVDQVICLATPTEFHAVGPWYRNFEQTTDEEVLDLLRRARTEEGTSEEGPERGPAT